MATSHRALTRGALVLSGVLVGLIAAELGLRLWAPAGAEHSDHLAALAADEAVTSAGETVFLADLLQPTADPDRVYELRPNLDCVFRGVEVVTNRFGMRDRDVQRTKPRGSLRVVGLGDSVMFGWGVPVEAGYLRVAEAMLDATSPTGPHVELLNFGVPGYNTAMQVALFDDLAAGFQPDALVLHFVNNDLELPRFMLETADRWSLDRWWLADLARGGWSAVEQRGGWVSPAEVAKMGERRGGRVRAKYAHLAGEEPFRRAMADLADSARARSIPVIFLVLQADGDPWQTAVAVASELGFRVAVAGPRFLRYLSEHHIEASRDGWVGAFSVSSDDPHPNATGHRLFAETLVEALTAELPVKR